MSSFRSVIARKWNTHIKKNVAERTRMIVHDENDEAVIGDKVIIEAVGRKISNKKTFAIKEFVKRGSYEHEFYQHLNDPKGIEAVKESMRNAL